LILFLLYQNPFHSKSASFDDFDSRNLSKYFSGIVAFENKNNSKALNFFNNSKILLNKHEPYLKRYVYSLVLENKVNQAINVIKQNKNNSEFFEKYLLLTIDSIRRNDFSKALNYISETKKHIKLNRFNSAVLDNLRDYVFVFNEKKLPNDLKNYGNLSIISKTLQSCYLGDVKTKTFFSKLVNNDDADLTRYTFFYLAYLIENNQIEEAKKITKGIKFINTSLLLSQGKSWIENGNEKKIKLFLLPKDEADTKNAMIEIRAGTGGLEASLFAGDLFKMYEKVCNKKKWSLELISISRSDAGGLKEVIASIKGNNINSTLKYESGVHRVQRVPDTETQGRVHTSAATVAVLPEAEEVDVKIEDKDLRIDVFRSSGPGGQSVNTTDSAVRITHIPTGIVVSQQDEKSQIRNKEKGLKILRSRIYEFERNKRDEERAKDRKSKIGSGDRSERIRTYNFPQGRVTDHRINLTLHKLEEFMEGEIFDEMIDNLSLQAQEEELKKIS